MSLIDVTAVLFSISDLLVRSPSCSCVLDDVLELLVNSLGFEAGLVCLKNDFGQSGLISHYQREETIGPANEIVPTLCKVQAEDVMQEKFDWTNKGLIFRETGDYLLASFPIWLENKVRGSLCLMGRRGSLLHAREIEIIQVITNQISHAIEKELLRDSFSNLKYFFYSVLESVTEGIVIYNEQRVLYINHIAQKMLQLEEDKKELELAQFTRGVNRLSKDKRLSQVYLETAFSLKYPRYSFELETSDKRYLRFTTFLINENGKGELGAGFLISDITRQKEAEQFKDDLLAFTSHELRTPLTSIKGNICSLLRKDVTWSKENQELFLRDAYEECERLEELIKNQLDIAKIKAGALKLDLNLITVKDLFKKVKQLLEKRYTKLCSIKFAITEQEAVLNIDVQRISQVILNLVDNAVKHGPAGVTVEISVQKRDRQLVFSVKDNGYGILPEHQHNIFDKYYFGKKKNGQLSSGLGLAICKGIVEAHQGSIWLKSVAGEGSCFSFTLPFVNAGLFLTESPVKN